MRIVSDDNLQQSFPSKQLFANIDQNGRKDEN